MDEDPADTQIAEDGAAAPDGRPEVTAADLAAVDIEAPIAGMKQADTHSLFNAYNLAYKAAEGSDRQSAAVFGALASLCSMRLAVEERGDPWQPMFQLANNNRSALPEDFMGDQATALAGVVGSITNPVLRARVADVTWTCNRRDGASARIAIDAYCDVVVGLIDGTLEARSAGTVNRQARDAIYRAMRIAIATTKRDKRPPRVAVVLETIHAKARSENDIATFLQTCRLSGSYGLRKPEALAQELEDAATAATGVSYPVAVKEAWEEAAALHVKMGNDAARQQCLKSAAMRALDMRGHGSGPGANAAWVTEALQILRHVKGEDHLVRQLESELRELQQAALRSMATFKIDLGTDDLADKVEDIYSTLPVSEALRQFAILTRSPDPKQLREDARASALSSPLMAMMRVQHLDNEGRPAAISEGAPNGGEPTESWYRRTIGQAERVRRASVVSGLIEPARVTIQLVHGIGEHHFDSIVGYSPFIPLSQKSIIRLGFTRLFQGDLMSAAHLLIPQIEPCLRHLLKMAGYDPSKRRDDTTEEDLSLSGIYTHFSVEIEQIFGKPIAAEIDQLFNARPGPALRHELAHGQLSAAECFSETTYYALWFIYHLCCVPLLREWDQLVTRQLQEDA